MKVTISGKNYQLTKALKSIKSSLDSIGVHYHVDQYGSGSSPMARGSTEIVIYDGSVPLMQYFMLREVHVEVVEETPGVIFKYVSKQGNIDFIGSTQEVSVDTDYDYFEDEESYSNRMRKIGVFV